MKSLNIKKRVYITAIILSAIFIIGYYGTMIVKSTNRQEYTVTVTDKMRVTYNYLFWTEHKYLVFTEDENGVIQVFENTDAPLYGKYNSSDYYAKIKTGETYTFKTAGYRLPYMSIYRNIIGVSETSYINEVRE